MKLILKSVPILLAVVFSIAHGNEIRCYACEDCDKEVPQIVKCDAKNGFDLNALSYNPTYPILTPSTANWYGNPWDPLLTPPPYPPVGNQNNPWDPLLTPPPLVGGNNGDAWYNTGYPILTPPPLNGGINQNNPWDPLLTPPPLVGGGGEGGGSIVLTPPTTHYPYGKANLSRHLKGQQKRFVCATIRSKGKDLQKNVVHRRGGAEIEGYAVGVCDPEQMRVSEDGMTTCRVCGHSLCNE